MVYRRRTGRKVIIKSKKTNKIPRKYIPKKQSEKTITRIVNKVINKKTEVKHIDYDFGTTQLFHNSYVTGAFRSYVLLGNLNQPSQGAGENNIIGSEYNVIGAQMYVQLSTKNDRLNTKFRVMVLRIPTHVNPTNYTQIFDQITGNVLLDPVDKGRATVLYDRVIGAKNMNPTNSTDEITMVRKIWIPKQKYKVKQSDDGNQVWITPKFQDMILIMAYDAQGSLQTDNIGAVQVARRLWFTDI